MRRLIDEQLADWRTSVNRKPLVVRGARQVGKTYSVTSFGHESFDNLCVVNFERNPDLCRLFQQDLDPRRIVKQLEVIQDTRITGGTTLLFFDEIQACPKAIQSLKYFAEEMPQLHVAAAGSLLEFALGDISFPVGQVQLLEMQPMTFVEFLWATGAESAASSMMSGPTGFSQTAHESVLEKLRYYCMVGGMPGAVASYVQTDSVSHVREVLTNLVETYRQDFSKYSPAVDRSCLDDVLLSVARSVGSQVKYSRLSGRFSYHTNHQAFNLLCTARLLNRIPHATPAGLPLSATQSEKVFKALVLDVGLMHALAGMPLAGTFANEDLLAVYRGAVAEQFVGQEIRAATGELFYWSRRARGSTAEVDYLVAFNGRVCPVEVKSGPAGKLKSLRLCLTEYPGCPHGIVLSTAQRRHMPEYRLHFVPLYCARSVADGTWFQ